MQVFTSEVLPALDSVIKDAERYRQFRALTLNGLDDTPDEFDKEFDMQISSPENP